MAHTARAYAGTAMVLIDISGFNRATVAGTLNLIACQDQFGYGKDLKSNRAKGASLLITWHSGVARKISAKSSVMRFSYFASHILVLIPGLFQRNC